MNIDNQLLELGIINKSKVKQNNKTKLEIVKDLEGKIISNEYGKILIKEEEIDLPLIFGNAELTNKKLGKYSSEYFELEGDKNDLIFIDTETTGLSRGNSTYAFMIGIGFFRKNHLVIRQYFLIDLNFEKALLYEFLEFIKNKTIISFNGKSFDINLLNNRLGFHNISLKISNKHFDMLHICRRFWKNEFSRYSLDYLEYTIFNFLRTEQDIDGSIIPEIYGYYLINCELDDIEKIFYHNKIDIITLIALFSKIQKSIDTGEIDYSSEYYGLAEIHQNKRIDLAISFLEKGRTASKNKKVSEAVLTKLGKIYKREKKWQKALSAWRELTILGNIKAFIEIAKYYEHNKKDYKMALKYTVAALDILKDHENKINKELNNRKNRLMKKIESEN